MGVGTWLRNCGILMLERRKILYCVYVCVFEVVEWELVIYLVEGWVMII